VTSEIELGIDPAEVDGEEAFEVLVGLVKGLGLLLGKPVYVTLEDFHQWWFLAYWSDKDRLMLIPFDSPMRRINSQ
jgi:hypothetical protein